MKFKIMLKLDHGTLNQLRFVAEKEVNQGSNLVRFSYDERAEMIRGLIKSMRASLGRWIEQKTVAVEFDTDAGVAMLVPVSP